MSTESDCYVNLSRLSGDHRPYVTCDHSCMSSLEQVEVFGFDRGVNTECLYV